MRATRRTRWSPRPESRPASSSRRSNAAAPRVSGASSSSRAPSMSAFVSTPRARAISRAAATRDATVADASPTAGPMSSSTLGRITGTRRSNRSTSGPDTRLMYRCRIASLHGHAPGFPPSPHGHGFIAATSRTLAGNATVALARLTRTTPSSSGWRSPSSTGAMNSASSSRNSTPWFARLSSPGRIDAPPPPTSETIDELWCGAAERWVADQPAARQAHARRRVHDRDVERLRRAQRRQQSREARGEHRLARTRWPHHQQVMATRGRDLDGEPAELVPTDVREIRARARRARDREPARPATAPRRAARARAR